jgi:HPt (histidine-containing phosphotransfer) domain-containing protein
MPTEVFDPAALAAVARLQRPGRGDLVAAIVERFQADAPRHLDTLREAATRGDTLALSQCAHRLKGDSRRIGGNEVGQLCAQIEALGRSGALEGASELIAALDAALQRLSGALQTVSEGRVACAS